MSDSSSFNNRRLRPTLTAFLLIGTCLVLAGCASSGGDVESEAASEPPPPSAEEQWGVEVTSVRVSAAGHMIDFRYRILDAEKSKPLFERQTKPYLVDQASGKVLQVPRTAKLGPLRPSNVTPAEGKIYTMLFGNTGGVVQPGARVTVVIGDFRVEDLVVE
jgi:hypothetical protein